MKYLKTLLFPIMIVFISCGNSSNEKYQPEITNETFAPSKDSLYLLCSDLKGLGTLLIDKTNWNRVFADKGMPQFYSFEKKSSFCVGHWGNDDPEFDKYVASKRFPMKQLHLGFGYDRDYKVGEISIHNVDLAFLANTLVAISFNCTDDIKEHYIKKYGAGQGSLYEYSELKGTHGKPDFKFQHDVEEYRIWANDNVKMDYVHKSYGLTTAALGTTASSVDSCIISSQTRYKEFMNILNTAKKEYKEDKENRVRNSYNSL